MQLPVDVMALIDEMTNIGSARDADLSVNVYVDNAAPADVVAHVRGAFASASSAVRMTISYLDSSFSPRSGVDLAIIVAGASRSIGAAAAALRGLDVPTAVVTTLPAKTLRQAQEGGHAIPDADIVAPCDGFEYDEAAEPLELTDELAAKLDARLGRWLASACPDKHLAFGVAFPFLRRPLAVESVQATSLQNAGIGLVSLIPGADMPIMTLNQAKMVLQIAAAYGQEMNADRVKELAAVVGGAYLCRTIARELIELVPVLGFITRTGVAYGGTAALGYGVIEYFEGGQDVAGLTNVASAAAKTVGKVVKLVCDDPAAAASKLGSRVSRDVSVARSAVTEYVPIIRDAVVEYEPRMRAKVKEYVPQVKQAIVDTARSFVMDGSFEAPASAPATAADVQTTSAAS